MAEGWLPVAANALLTAQLDIYRWMKLHVGAPGAAGTANPAVETTRKEITWGTASAGQRASVTNDLVWTSIAGSEDATHCSLHDAVTAGAPGLTGTITANPYNAGDILTIPAGSVVATVPLAS